jgi:hypothetical protein
MSKAFARVTGWPSRLTTAGKAGWSMAAFLVLATVFVWAVFLTEPGHVAPRHAFTPGRIAAVASLLLLIPLATHQLVRLWLEGDRSRFPEIDFAWDAGLDAIRRSGLTLNELPIFVVLGSPGERAERAITAACGDDFRVRGVPEGPSPLHWHVGPDRAYLFLTDPSWVSGLAALATRRRQAPSISPAALAALAAAASPSGLASGTVSFDQFAAKAGAGPQAAGGDAYRGTLALESLAPAAAARVAGRDVLAEVAPPAALEQPALLPAQESARRLEQLEYVARKLRLARRPLCGANGVLVLLPFELIRGEADEKDELARAVRADLTTLQNGLEVRVPVTALLTGLEQEPGFQELVRRVGRDRAAAQRFGRRYDVRALPTPAEMAATSAHVCGAFEDWIYSLFREEDAMSRPGTSRLYGLLCRVRCHLREPLADLLARGFGFDPALRPGDLPFLFSGCYVAATGEAEDRRAFVRGVFEKLAAEQEDVEWTPASLAAERRHLRVAGALNALNAVLAASLFAMAVYAAM